MKDGTDAVSDWPLLNALLNTASGATWVSLHHGGGVGMGFSQHAGVVIVCDGTDAAARAHRARAVERPGHGRDAPRRRRLRRRDRERAKQQRPRTLPMLGASADAIGIAALSTCATLPGRCRGRTAAARRARSPAGRAGAGSTTSTGA